MYILCLTKLASSLEIAVLLYRNSYEGWNFNSGNYLFTTVHYAKDFRIFCGKLPQFLLYAASKGSLEKKMIVSGTSTRLNYCVIFKLYRVFHDFRA